MQLLQLHIILSSVHVMGCLYYYACMQIVLLIACTKYCTCTAIDTHACGFLNITWIAWFVYVHSKNHDE